MNTKTTLTLLVVIAALLTTTAAAAETFSFRLGGSDAAITDTEYDFISDDNFLSMGQLGIEYSLIDGIWLGLEYDWALETFDPVAGVSTELDIDGLMASIRAQHELLPFFSPYGRIGFGFQHLEFQATFDGEPREQDAFVLTGNAMVGFELHLPKKWVKSMFRTNSRGWAKDLTFGIIFEGGYQFASNANFDKLERPEPEREPEPEDKPLDAAPIRLGEVDLSGVVMRSAFIVRF